MDQKSMVHLHNGILCNREKIGAYTLCNHTDGIGEHYAKWNKPCDEQQIPYYLTFNQDIMYKGKKQAKYNQGHWKYEQSDSNPRGGGWG